MTSFRKVLRPSADHCGIFYNWRGSCGLWFASKRARPLERGGDVAVPQRHGIPLPKLPRRNSSFASGGVSTHPVTTHSGLGTASESATSVSDSFPLQTSSCRLTSHSALDRNERDLYSSLLEISGRSSTRHCD
eukprot:g17011.t1